MMFCIYIEFTNYYTKTFIVNYINFRTWKERIVVSCIKNNIAVFSPHTSWDVVVGGGNDWILSAFSTQNQEPIIPNAENPIAGVGRYATLPEAIKLDEAIKCIKEHFQIPHLRLALAKDKDESKWYLIKVTHWYYLFYFEGSLIKSIAICAGAGGSAFKHRSLDADLYLTGEMSHHDVLNLTQNGSHVILSEHSNSERGFLTVFKKKLQNEILSNQVEVLVSAVDHDPLKIV